MRITGISFQPPLAFARLGGASTPMDNYIWRYDPTIHGSSRNAIDPALTFDVLADGSIFPFTPTLIRFREHGKLRPVAPFFELWASVVYGTDDAGHEPGGEAEVPLTGELLQEGGGKLSSLVYGVAVANKKAARRTGDDSNAFAAGIQVRGDDFAKHQLLASSPTLPGGTPLVDPTRPIPLGYFQVIRPVPTQVNAVNLNTLRVRFTPAGGEVYGPPTAVLGRDDATGRSYEIVRETNRILNPGASWTRYQMADTDPQPADTYDGADQGQNRSWGVVDDTCDGVITANAVIGGRNLSATCRICVGPPDFAPDRRPFVSLADDLADRDCEPSDEEQLLANEAATQHRFADLLQRVWETASLTNLDAIRARAVTENARTRAAVTKGLPRTDQYSMRPKDVPYADANIKALIPTDPEPSDDLVFTQLIALAHESLADEDALIDFLLSRPDRVRQMIRPAYGAFPQLSESVSADADPNPHFRDPRITRDLLHDMRMPPYMRDETASPLGLTRRQFAELMNYLDIARTATRRVEAAGLLPSAAPTEGPDSAAVTTPLRRRVQQRLRTIGGGEL